MSTQWNLVTSVCIPNFLGQRSQRTTVEAGLTGSLTLRFCTRISSVKVQKRTFLRLSGLASHAGGMADAGVPSRTLHPALNRAKQRQTSRSLPESSPPTHQASMGREEVDHQLDKVTNVFDVRTARRRPEGRAGDCSVTLGAPFPPENSKLNRSPTYYSLLAKSMRPRSSVDPSHSHAGGQLSHRGARQGEKVASQGLDPEENRPRKSHRPRTSETFINGINSPSETNRAATSLLYHFNILREDYNKQLCSVECRKEKNERQFYCSSDFVTLDKRLQMVTLMVDSNGFYRMSRLYVTPDGFFFKVHILVVDTFNCRRLCPDLKLGGRYIVMGLIYHRRYPLPMWVQQHVAGRLKPGDGLLKSSSYVRRFNKKRDRKVQLISDENCDTTFL
ncbi:UPF0450 protein C17orf58 homolog isoform X2 [Narcine bancroftii]|uniref:UPF0450 protein C17orf58 homolog isoform X2 n=1 Tax=Narcine bancroftii TaxID=1343680 RepID=UPI0038311119